MSASESVYLVNFAEETRVVLSEYQNVVTTSTKIRPDGGADVTITGLVSNPCVVGRIANIGSEA